MSYINGVATLLPEKRVSLNELYAEGVLTRNEQLSLESQGFAEVASSEGQTGAEMVCEVIARLFEQEKFHPSNVVYVIITYQLYPFPYCFDIFSLLREKFGMTSMEGVTVRDLHCSTWVAGIEVADRMLESTESDDDLAIVVSVTKCELPATRFDSVFVTGDSCGAVLLNKKKIGDQIIGSKQIMDVRTITLGDQGGGARWDITYLFVVKMVIDGLLRERRLKPKDVRIWIPNNAPRDLWANLMSLFRMGMERFYTEGMERFGHLFMNDILFNYQAVIQTDVLNEGDLFVLVALGNEGTAGGLLCKKGS